MYRDAAKPSKRTVTGGDEEASSSRTRSREIATELSRRIIEGTYPAGSKLPTERDLAEQFGVARTVVREALKRIEALRLITIRQGSGARVEDSRTAGGIELADLLMHRRDGSLDTQFLKDVGQLHAAMHGWLVKLVAERITPAEVEQLRRLLKERSSLPEDDERLPGITLEISRAIVEASHNRYINLLFNTLARTTKASRTIFESPRYFEPGIQTFFERLIEAFENRDPEMAMLLVARAFASNQENYTRAVGPLSPEIKLPGSAQGRVVSSSETAG